MPALATLVTEYHEIVHARKPLRSIRTRWPSATATTADQPGHPRPIALVTTLGPTGVVNAAPFSFFNMFSESPAALRARLQCRTTAG
jgi:hypothetical protein